MQLPRKMSAQNVMASISRSLGKGEQKVTTGNEIRFAGDERKDKLYEPKHKQKLVRVLTVVAYVIFVSMAAILLSLYYTFLWDPKDPSVKVRIRQECGNPKVPLATIGGPAIFNETQTHATPQYPSLSPAKPELNSTTQDNEDVSVLTGWTALSSTSVPSTSDVPPLPDTKSTTTDVLLTANPAAWQENNATNAN